MPELLADCPHCDTYRMTFDVVARIVRTQDGWQNRYEVYCICRHCNHPTVFVLSERENADYEHMQKFGILKINGSLNKYLNVDGYVSAKDKSTVALPKVVPNEIGAIFEEASTCLAVGCYNAAGSMFRLCVDRATRSMLPEKHTEGLTAQVRGDLGLRLGWLFDKGLLPDSLKELSSFIEDDGNDGAPANSQKRSDIEAAKDFTAVLLESIFST